MDSSNAAHHIDSQQKELTLMAKIIDLNARRKQQPLPQPAPQAETSKEAEAIKRAAADYQDRLIRSRRHFFKSMGFDVDF